MNSGLSYVFPSLLAVVFHGLLIAALLTNWVGAEVTEVTAVEPYYIEAALVQQNPHRAREQRAAAEATARAETARTRQKAEQNRQAAERRSKIAAENLAKAAAAREQELAEQSTPAPEVAASTTAPAAVQPEVEEEARQMMENSLQMAILDEQEYRRAVTDDEKAMAYVAQIQAEIVQNWSRPPSARNGMQALLKVRLVPTGEVVDVAVIESSGNDSFDRSAIIAVEKAERFVVPTDSRQFERNFREFEVLFRPEDLRL